MNKKSHLFITGKIAEKVPEKNRVWFLFGSILPDILFHTYLKGHLWESSFDTISRKMYELEKNGRNSAYSYLMLGYILHYVEDFYTLAHNPIFEGGLPKHIAYEKGLAEYLKKKEVLPEKENDSTVSLTATLEYLKRSHKEYLEKAGDFETDIHYIYEAAEAVSKCLLRAIAVNSSVSFSQSCGIYSVFLLQSNYIKKCRKIFCVERQYGKDRN